MNRRHFLCHSAVLLAVPGLLVAGNNTVDYTPGLIQQKLNAGETVFVDFAADWCSTCKRQERVISEIRANNPEFDKNMSFVRVDWDTYSSHAVTTSRKIPRRSTLIILRGEEELGRLVAGTSSDDIKALMELGLTSS